ncbi:uncharacterized protein LOC116026989 [Ipomoea triloba]|uniref:uncharacterized protein LOC116026989 n=1 Tax=Ipomoea triloba TaxID=35885 RepID=UPI00125E0E31|nr:uncharacterized protein LOC116026989 [Ipomoea triloba]
MVICLRGSICDSPQAMRTGILRVMCVCSNVLCMVSSRLPVPGLTAYTLSFSVGFTSSKTDVSLFIYSAGSVRLYLLVYVDDILVMGSDLDSVTALVAKMGSEFKIRDMGASYSYCLSRVDVGTAIPYADPTQYRSLAGALQYLMVTRPDLSFAVNKLCQHMRAPTTEHWGMLKRVLRYMKGTLHFGLCICRSSSIDIHAFSDYDWAGDPGDRKSTSGFAVFIGRNLVSWVCRKQRTVARSSTEAEYKALADVSAEVTWLARF